MSEVEVAVGDLEVCSSVASTLLDTMSGREPQAEAFLSQRLWAWARISPAVMSGVLGRFTRPMYSIVSS